MGSGGNWKKYTDEKTGEVRYEPMDAEARALCGGVSYVSDPSECLRESLNTRTIPSIPISKYRGNYNENNNNVPLSSSENNKTSVYQTNLSKYKESMRLNKWGPWLNAESILAKLRRMKSERQKIEIYDALFDAFSCNIITNGSSSSRKKQNDQTKNIMTKDSFLKMAQKYCTCFGEKDEWNLIWQVMDYNQEMHLTKENFTTVMMALDPSTVQIDHLIGHMNEATGKLDFSESHIPTLNRMKQIFRLYDEDRDGFLNVQELGTLLRSLAKSVELFELKKCNNIPTDISPRTDAKTGQTYYNLEYLDEDRCDYMGMMNNPPKRMAKGKKSARVLQTGITRDTVKLNLLKWSETSPIAKHVSRDVLGDSDDPVINYNDEIHFSTDDGDEDSPVNRNNIVLDQYDSSNASMLKKEVPRHGLGKTDLESPSARSNHSSVTIINEAASDVEAWQPKQSSSYDESDTSYQFIQKIPNSTPDSESDDGYETDSLPSSSSSCSFGQEKVDHDKSADEFFKERNLTNNSSSSLSSLDDDGVIMQFVCSTSHDKKKINNTLPSITKTIEGEKIEEETISQFLGGPVSPPHFFSPINDQQKINKLSENINPSGSPTSFQISPVVTDLRPCLSHDITSRNSFVSLSQTRVMSPIVDISNYPRPSSSLSNHIPMIEPEEVVQRLRAEREALNDPNLCGLLSPTTSSLKPNLELLQVPYTSSPYGLPSPAFGTALNNNIKLTGANNFKQPSPRGKSGTLLSPGSPISSICTADLENSPLKPAFGELKLPQPLRDPNSEVILSSKVQLTPPSMKSPSKHSPTPVKLKLSSNEDIAIRNSPSSKDNNKSKASSKPLLSNPSSPNSISGMKTLSLESNRSCFWRLKKKFRDDPKHQFVFQEDCFERMAKGLIEEYGGGSFGFRALCESLYHGALAGSSYMFRLKSSVYEIEANNKIHRDIISLSPSRLPPFFCSDTNNGDRQTICSPTSPNNNTTTNILCCPNIQASDTSEKDVLSDNMGAPSYHLVKSVDVVTPALDNQDCQNALIESSNLTTPQDKEVNLPTMNVDSQKKEQKIVEPLSLELITKDVGDDLSNNEVGMLDEVKCGTQGANNNNDPDNVQPILPTVPNMFPAPVLVNENEDNLPIVSASGPQETGFILVTAPPPVPQMNGREMRITVDGSVPLAEQVDAKGRKIVPKTAGLEFGIPVHWQVPARSPSRFSQNASAQSTPLRLQSRTSGSSIGYDQQDPNYGKASLELQNSPNHKSAHIDVVFNNSPGLTFTISDTLQEERRRDVELERKEEVSLWRPLLNEMCRLFPDVHGTYSSWVYDPHETTNNNIVPSNNLVFALVNFLFDDRSLNSRLDFTPSMPSGQRGAIMMRSVLSHPCLDICISYFLEARGSEHLFPKVDEDSLRMSSNNIKQNDQNYNNNDKATLPSFSSGMSGTTSSVTRAKMLNTNSKQSNNTEQNNTSGLCIIPTIAYSNSLREILTGLDVIMADNKIQVPKNKILVFTCDVQVDDPDDDVARGFLLAICLKLLAPKRVHILRSCTLFYRLSRSYLSDNHRDSSPLRLLLPLWLSLPFAICAGPIMMHKSYINYIVLPEYPAIHDNLNSIKNKSKTTPKVTLKGYKKFDNVIMTTELLKNPSIDSYNGCCWSDYKPLEQVLDEVYDSKDHWTLEKPQDNSSRLRKVMKLKVRFDKKILVSAGHHNEFYLIKK